MEHVEIRGLRIAFERTDSGPPLVLLHGGLSDGREWRRQLDGLVADFTLVAWDAPGCGRSSDPPGSFRMPDYADCLAQFIDVLGLDRPHVPREQFARSFTPSLLTDHAPAEMIDELLPGSSTSRSAARPWS
jgi:alpha-beta hydrolase superfamily lysophospholipase